MESYPNNIEVKSYIELDAEHPETIELEKQVVSYVEELLVSQKNQIGKGKTAEVHFLDMNPNICLKVISKTSSYSTVEKTSEMPQGQRHHSLLKEADYLSDVSGLDESVKTPDPLYVVTHRREIETDDSYATEEVSVLAMERIKGNSIKDIVEGKASIPEGFKIDEFMSKLRKYFERLHDKGIHHRDAHEGNIMVGPNGEPYVIDFGLAEYGRNEDEVYQSVHGRIVTRYTKDTANVDRVEKLLRNEI